MPLVRGCFFKDTSNDAPSEHIMYRIDASSMRLLRALLVIPPFLSNLHLPFHQNHVPTCSIDIRVRALPNPIELIGE
jgi:hypothetical protein